MKVIALFTSPDEAAAARLVLELEAAVLEEPDGLPLKLIGPGGLPSWAALAMADLLARRAAETRLAAQAYGSMGASDWETLWRMFCGGWVAAPRLGKTRCRRMPPMRMGRD